MTSVQKNRIITLMTWVQEKYIDDVEGTILTTPVQYDNIDDVGIREQHLVMSRKVAVVSFLHPCLLL